MRKNTDKTHAKPILWGAPGSAYSARTRSYLIKKGLPYQEIFPGHRRFYDEIVPLIGYFVMPVTELTDGTLIQDSTDTVVYFEERYPENPLIPTAPRQKAIAWLLGYMGSEMMHKIAMHYRWNYLGVDKPFTEATFGHFFSTHRDMELQRKDIAPIMAYFDGFLEDLGVTEQTAPAIEAAYLELLAVLNAHFMQSPYLLGGRPSLADFGLIAPMFAHLARDPHSSQLTKLSAPQVFRWTERMNQAGIVDGEFADMPPEYPPDDALPETLLPILQYFFKENGLEILGMIETFNTWCDQHPDPKPGTTLRTAPESVTAHPMLGTFTYQMRGVSYRRQTFASGLYFFQRVLDVISALDKTGRESFEKTMRDAGGEAVMAAQMRRRIKHEDDQYMLE
jgi:glutathione S-transferase